MSSPTFPDVARSIVQAIVEGCDERRHVVRHVLTRHADDGVSERLVGLVADQMIAALGGRTP